MNVFQQHRRSGYTLVELLVVLGLIFLLLSLLVPAVLSAREASRRAACTNRLKQMILATHSYESSHGGFPRSSRVQMLPNGESNQMSLLCELLPYLELSSLYQSINFELPCANLSQINPNHLTVAAVRVEVFLCPSDSQFNSSLYAPTNYRANVGLGEFTEVTSSFNQTNTLQFDQSGAFVFTWPVLPLASFSDGLSNTVAFTEKLVGSDRPNPYDPSRDWISTPGINPQTADGWIALCSNLSSSDVSSAQSNAGRTWVLSGGIYTETFLSVTPNSQVPDCGTTAFLGVGVFGARSHHPGGVNAAFADGSTRWISSGIDLQVWRSLGTRNRGD